MSDMNKPEMTAQVLVAVGAVFLLISAYVMGVYIPEQRELSDDFESQTSFDGDMTLFDATKSATLQGDFNPENALNSYLSADGANVQILAKADPALSDDDKTYYNFNASAFTSAEMSEDTRILTFSDYNNYVDRTTWETKDADDPEDEFGYSLWNPNELPEKKNTEYPNPFVSSHTNTYIYVGEEDVGGIDCYKYTADETFEYSSSSVLALKANFDGFLPEGVEGTSYGEMQYKEIIWVGKETGQVADRQLDVTVNFIPDPRLAVLFQATEGLNSTIVYEGTLDGSNITADRRTFSSGPIFSGTDNATGETRTYMNATGTLFVSGETEPRVDSTFLIDTHTQQAQGLAPDGTYISGGSTFFSIGSVCDNSTYNYPNLFLSTHVNTYGCLGTESIPGYIIPSAGIMGNTTVYHYQSIENGVLYDTTTASLPVFDPVNGYCMNPAACPDRQWAPLIAFALTQTSLGEDALQIPIRSDATMTLPRFTTDMSMIMSGEAIMGSQYHPLIQTSFTSIDDYATSLGLDVSYTSMPFVLDPNGTTSLPIPGDTSCVMGTDNDTCVMGSSFTHPLVAGIMGEVMSGLGADPNSYQALPWYTNGEAVLPVIDDGTLMVQGKALMGHQFHPLIIDSLSATQSYGVDYLNVPWRTVNETDVPITKILPNMSADGDMYYMNGLDSYTTDITQAFLGNMSNPADPSTWVVSGTCTLADMNMTTGICVPMYEYLPFTAPLQASSVMPNITPAQLPLFDVDAATPVIEDQELQLLMDYEENVYLDPVTATVLDQDITILVTVTFPWGTQQVAQSIDVAYTEAQKLSSSSSRWTAEFGYTFIPGSPVRADNANFTIMTLKGGYSDAEVADAKQTIEDTSSALSSARTIPMALIGVALVSLMGGFYVYYQNNQGGDMSSGMDESASEETAPSMAVTEEDSEEEAEDSGDDSDEESGDSDE